MTDAGTATGDTEGTGAYEWDGWSDDGTAAVAARGADADAAIMAGLRAVVEAAGGTGTGADESDSGSVAAPIRGQGVDLAAVFGELAADLLAQLDANGAGLAEVRLDGLLQTDDGGYTAWGYAVGASVASPPPINVTLEGEPTLEQASGGPTIRFRLRRDVTAGG